MKITREMRLSVESAHAVRTILEFDEQSKAEVAHLKKFVKQIEKQEGHDEISMAMDQYRQACAEVASLEVELHRLLSPYGLKHTDRLRLDSRDRFLAAGGKEVPGVTDRWRPSEVFAKLARASHKDAKSILASYGINWE